MSSYAEILSSLKATGNLRAIPSGQTGSKVIDLSSNDYLGLGADRALLEEFMDSPERRAIPLTSSASRLLAGRQNEYDSLEHRLEQLYGRPALLFNSGYHANTGLVSSLASAGKTLILADRLVHASIIDGIILSRAEFRRFPHNDFARLRRLLEREAAGYERVLVIAESVYSMDGDRAEIPSLVALKREFPNVMLYVDEAHAFGVEGPQGLGLSVASRLLDEIDVVMGTFGKACASMGAFASVSEELREYLLNTARSFIFSTALPPLNAAWTEWVIDRMVSMDSRRKHLRSLATELHSILAPMQPGTAIEPSHIQPLIVGDAARAVELSKKLLERGFKVLPIRTPTVPPGTERLRFSLSSALSIDDISALKDAF